MPGGFGTGFDVATLGLRVDASEVKDATGALTDLQRQGERVEQTTGRVTASARGMGRGMGTVANTLERTAVSAGGVNARLARTVSTLAQFAPSATLTVGILAALTTIAVAFRQIGKDAREAAADAEAAFQRSLALLNKIADASEDQLPGALGQVRQRLFAAQAERSQLEGPGGRVPLAGVSGERYRELTALIAELERAEAAGVGAILDNNIRNLTDSVRELDRAARASMSGFDPTGAGGVPGEPTTILDMLGLSDDALHRQRQAGFNSPGFRKLAEEQQLLLEAQQGATEDLGDANHDLIRSLENVGRAYGGVIDQVFALSGATLQLANSGGHAAAAGGSQLFAPGNVGGLTGFATGVGLLNAVGSIVEGLIDSGERAREAQRVWERAFVDFERMFDEPGTELEQNLEAMQRAFEDLGAAAIENAGTFGIEALIKELERLDDARKKNIKQAKELTDAEDDLGDSRFRALNAPAGLNLQRYGFGAVDWGAIGVPDKDKDKDKGITVGGDLNITVDGGDSDEIVENIKKAIKRDATRGGPGSSGWSTRR